MYHPIDNCNIASAAEYRLRSPASLSRFKVQPPAETPQLLRTVPRIADRPETFTGT